MFIYLEYFLLWNYLEDMVFLDVFVSFENKIIPNSKKVGVKKVKVNKREISKIRKVSTGSIANTRLH